MVVLLVAENKQLCEIKQRTPTRFENGVHKLQKFGRDYFYPKF